MHKKNNVCALPPLQLVYFIFYYKLYLSHKAELCIITYKISLADVIFWKRIFMFILIFGNSGIEITLGWTIGLYFQHFLYHLPKTLTSKEECFNGCLQASNMTTQLSWKLSCTSKIWHIFIHIQCNIILFI